MLNLSLKRRIGASFIVANLVVLVLGFTLFFYLDSLSRNIERITTQVNRMMKETDLVRISAIALLEQQQSIQSSRLTEEQKEGILTTAGNLSRHLSTLENRFTDVEIGKKISKMTGYVESLKTITEKIQVNRRNSVAVSNIGDLAMQILQAVGEFLEIQLNQSDEREREAKEIIAEIRRNMLISLIITFLGTILLGLIVPGKIALPFKKISDAVRELQDNNFDVSIFYEQNDEIGELAADINKMISSIKKFDELRTERINLEQRKFDALANLVKKNILVANSEGHIIYMNNQLYSLLELESDDVIRKNISDTLIPEGIKDACQLAIKRRSKIENQEIVIYNRKTRLAEEEEATEESQEAESAPAPQEEGHESQSESETDSSEIFNGYATVIPIRGKDSTLDYYLTVLTQEML